MCGIVATCQLGGSCILLEDRIKHEQALEASLELIKHRGPDGFGIWVEEAGSCALGHCRLSINDLSPSGDQPLHSSDCKLHAVVNGEIYDHDRLRAELFKTTGYVFRGGSDSELVLALYARDGIDFLQSLRGEFALCLYDSGAKTFIAARDRYGVKPLFWRRNDAENRIEFAAEMKAFRGLGWEPEWDVPAIVSGGWGQDTRTVFKGVSKIRPGHYMVIKEGHEPEFEQYWDISYPNKGTPEARTEEEMIHELRSHLLDSVRLRLRADVPVGIYLSGGIDSSALAGIAAHLVKEEGVSMGSNSLKDGVCCFSIGFDQSSGADESDIAQRTADHLGVKFLKSHMDEQTLADNFTEAVYHIEHHTHDLNFVGKFVLSSLPRQHGYKVVLTGEGADEQFGGYGLYYPDFLLQEAKSRGQWEKEVEAVAESYEIIGGQADWFPKGREAGGELGHLITPAAMLGFVPPSSIYTQEALHTSPIDPLETITRNIDPSIQAKIRDEWHPLHGAEYIWTKGHLSNQFLSCLGDRVEMSHSVEARVPFLDHKLTEYVNHLPATTKIRETANGQPIEKWILRQAVKPFITDELYNRKKHAYTAPHTYPVDGPVHRMLKDFVTEEKVKQLGFVQWKTIQGLWEKAFEKIGEGASERQKGKVVWAWRMLLIVAAWVVLAERFAVKTARR